MADPRRKPIVDQVAQAIREMAIDRRDTTAGDRRDEPRGGRRTTDPPSVRGFPCPSCKQARTRVLDTQPRPNLSAMRRRRQCTACGHRFWTLERIAAA